MLFWNILQKVALKFYKLLHICENIRNERKRLGRSQQEIADLLKVNRSTYAKYELDRVPDIETLVEIGRIFKVDWTSFVKETITGEPLKPGTYRTNPDIMQIKEVVERTEANTDSLLKRMEELEKLVRSEGKK